MVYLYKCETCGQEFDVVKMVEDFDRPEACECGSPAKRQLPRKIYLIGTKVNDAEYNHGLGMVIHSKRERDEEAKKRGLVEVGNDYGSAEKMQKEFDTARERKREESWDEAI